MRKELDNMLRYLPDTGKGGERSAEIEAAITGANEAAHLLLQAMKAGEPIETAMRLMQLEAFQSGAGLPADEAEPTRND